MVNSTKTKMSTLSLCPSVSARMVLGSYSVSVGWMHEWTDGRTDTGARGRVDGCTVVIVRGRWVSGWMTGRLGRWWAAGGRTDARVSGGDGSMGSCVVARWVIKKRKIVF